MRKILLLALIISGLMVRAQSPDSMGCKTYFKWEVNTQVMTLLPATAINFYDKSEGNVIAWWWDFGDGTTSEEQNPMHVFNHPMYADHVKMNPYRTVSLTTLTADSCKSFYSETINIMNSPVEPTSGCKAIFKYYQAAYDSLRGTVTYQFTNYSEGDSLHYLWEFDNGTTSTEKEPAVILDIKPAEHRACLTVTARDGSTNSFCDVLYFYDPNTKPDPHECSAAFGYTVNYDVKTFAPALVLDFYSKAYPEAVNLKWDFGDGTTSEEPNPQHMFNLPTVNDSAYTGANPFRNVCLTVTTTTGCIATYCEQIYLYMNTNPPVDPAPQCHAWFKYEKATDVVTIPELIPFVFRDVSEGKVVSRLWTFEDGTQSTEANVQKNFDFMKRTQKVCLTIFTADSCSSTWCETVYVPGGAPDTVYVNPVWNYTMRYESYFPQQMSSCAGWAKAQVYLKDSVVDAYNYVWSTGEIGQEVKGLCPTQMYTVKAITPDGTVVTGSFIFNSDGTVSETPLNWWITGVRDNPLIQAKPANTDYTVEWKLCDGTVVVGDSIPLNSINCGGSDANLIMKDAAGNVVYQETINMKILATYLTPDKLQASIKVFPNPVEDVLNIAYAGNPLKEMKVEIADISGKMVSVQTLSNIESGQTISLNVSPLIKGLYLCRLTSANQVISLQKFIK